MTSTLEELKTALYEDFDKARAKATYVETYKSDYSAAALYRQAAAHTAQVLLDLERRPSQKSPKASP